MADLVKRAARAACIAIGDDPDREGEGVTLTAYETMARAVLAEAGIAGEPEISYEIWKDGDDTEALFFDETAARLYAATYGPVEIVRVAAYRQKV